MIRKYKLILLILLIVSFLTGCWDYRDIDRRSVVLANGVDEADGNVEFVGEIAKLSSKGATSKEKEQVTSAYFNSAIGKNFEEARTKYNSKFPLEGFQGAVRVTVFGKKFAKAGILSYINRYYNVQEFRSSALVAVCNESVKEFFSSEVENDISIGYAVEDTIRYLSNNGEALYKTVQEIYSDIYFGDIGYLLPFITKKENTVEYLGLAVMKDSKLAGIINRDESGGFLFILSKKPEAALSIPHPDDSKNLLSIKSTLKKRKIKTGYEDNKVNIDIDIGLDSQLLYPYKIEPVDDEDIKKLEETISEKIKKDILTALERSKNEFECDAFGFGRIFKSQNIGIYRKINWKEEYLRADFHVNVTAKISNTNLIDPNVKKQK